MNVIKDLNVVFVTFEVYVVVFLQFQDILIHVIHLFKCHGRYKVIIFCNRIVKRLSPF